MESQQKFMEPNLFGHVYDGQKSEDGYAICSACDCQENTQKATLPCEGTMLGRKLSSLTQSLIAWQNRGRVEPE